MLPLLALEKRRSILPSRPPLCPEGLQMEKQKETTRFLLERRGL